jgi:hypothetical protein
MSFCPTCGAGVVAQAGAVPFPETASMPQYSTFTPPPVAAPPMAYPMPYPYYYARPPMTGFRMASVAGGIILLIDAILAGIAGVFMLFQWFYLEGILLLVGLAMGIVGAISVFIIRFPVMGIVGAAILMAGGLVVIFFVPWGWWIIGLIGLILATISLALILIGWRDLMEKTAQRFSFSMHPQMTGMPYGSVPPPGHDLGPGGPRY